MEEAVFSLFISVYLQGKEQGEYRRLIKFSWAKHKYRKPVESFTIIVILTMEKKGTQNAPLSSRIMRERETAVLIYSFVALSTCL